MLSFQKVRYSKDAGKKLAVKYFLGEDEQLRNALLRGSEELNEQVEITGDAFEIIGQGLVLGDDVLEIDFEKALADGFGRREAEQAIQLADNFLGKARMAGKGKGFFFHFLVCLTSS